MAASANPSGNQEAKNLPPSSTAANGGASNGGAVDSTEPQQSTAAAASAGGGEKMAATQAALRHNPGISTKWSSEEQSLLEELLVKYASDPPIPRYAKIAAKLNDKTVRDVALRCRWMTKKENGKRRKDDNSTTRKNKDKKEKVSDSSTKSLSYQTTRPNGPPYAPPVIPLDNDDGISFTDIGGLTGELLEQNAQMFNQISANFAAFQIHDNVNLLCKARDNIFAIMNDLKDAPEIMKQMPPLPVKVNEELANSILPRTSVPMKS